MVFGRIKKPLKRILGHGVKSSQKFFSTQQLLPSTLDDICAACPLGSLEKNGSAPDPLDWETVRESRKRYFAALLQSYLGKPGDEEINRLQSYQWICEGHYLRGAAHGDVANTNGTDAGTDTTEPDQQSGARIWNRQVD